ncbi:MAG TPA: amino acid synthesis family protein [Ramlibacter sp.]|jgi:hypothetical protein|nr:amino acid synthesis family protein [Ramlibacter sp.]
MKIRKVVTVVDQTFGEMGQHLQVPVKKVAAMAVIENPFAGRFERDLSTLEDAGEELGALLARAARTAANLAPEECEGYGKAAIVGTAGELEHGHAFIHAKFGAPIRAEFGGGKAVIPSTGKVGAAGVCIDVPTVYKHAFTVRSHYDSMCVSIPDAPHPGEIVVILVLTSSGRPLARQSGLRKDHVKGVDGLR